MQSNGPRLGLGLLALSFLTACGEPGRAVFDASAVPEPPQYTAKFKRDLAAEIEAAPRNDLIIQAFVDASQHYDRIRRLKGKKGKPQNE